jgi:hypothetical protein
MKPQRNLLKRAFTVFFISSVLLLSTPTEAAAWSWYPGKWFKHFKEKFEKWKEDRPKPGRGGRGNGGSPAVPVDGGLSILLVAGGAYGAKKLHDKRKNKGDNA